MSTYAGTIAGNVDGNTATARFNGPTGVCLDSQGNLYVADYGNHKIRKVDTSGMITTFAGNGTAGATDGTATTATFYYPAIVAVNSNDELFVTDQNNHKIRKISPTGVVTTYAGTGVAGANDEKATFSTFNSPTGIVVGPNDKMYIADYANHKIRKIQTYGYAITPNLPAGLNFNKNTGIITGQPLEPSPATDYTVIAENQDGSSTFTFSIEVQATLAVTEVVGKRPESLSESCKRNRNAIRNDGSLRNCPVEHVGTRGKKNSYHGFRTNHRSGTQRKRDVYLQDNLRLGQPGNKNS